MQMERQLGEGNVTNGEHVIKSTSAGLQCQRPEQEPLDWPLGILGSSLGSSASSGSATAAVAHARTTSELDLDLP